MSSHRVIGPDPTNQSLAIGILCIAVAGIAAQWLAWRLRLPAIVLLFSVGLIVGPGLQILLPHQMFGQAMRPLVSLAVAIVVFEGGLALEFNELRVAGQGVLRLTMLAPPIGLLLAAIAAHLLAGMDWGIAFLFGAITIVTGPTVILPLLRHTRLERRTASFLKWEAIVNDPVGALLAAAVLAILVARNQGVLAVNLLAGLPIAVLLGVGAGYVVRFLFTGDRSPELLKTPIVLAAALGVFVTANLVMDESGLAASTIFGITLANLRIPGLRELARFKEALAVLLVSALFIVLTASLDRALFTHLSWPILLLTLAMLVVVRPAAITLATIGSDLTWRERVLAGWIAPRGVVAAAIAGIAGARLATEGYAGADTLMPAVFALIAATMILHGFSLGPLARMLKLTLGDSPGLAIVGASAWSIQLAEQLTRAGVPTLLIDIFPGALDAARQLNLPVLQAELLSEHGSDALEAWRVDYVLVATPDELYNSLVSTRFIPDLGRQRVFQLGTAHASDEDQWLGHSQELRGHILGRPPVEHADLRKRFRQGWRFRFATEADPADPADSEVIEILTLRRTGALTIATPDEPARPQSEEDRRLILAPPTNPD